VATQEGGARPVSRAGGAAIFFFLLVPIAAGGGGLALAPMQALAALIGGPWGRLRPLLKQAGPALVLAGAFWVWCALSTLWSINPDKVQIFKLLAGLLCGGLFVAAAAGPAADRAVFRWAGALSACALCALLVVEALFAMPLNRLAQPDAIDWVLQRNPAKGAVVLVILAWGVAAWALSRLTPLRIAGVVAGGAVCAALGLAFEMDAVPTALAFGFAFWTAGLIWGRAAFLAAAGAHALAIVAAPWLVAGAARFASMQGELPHSWADRIDIWKAAATQALSRPFLGWGMDSARMQDGVPLHPHFLGIQIWMEMGAVGAGLAALAVAAAARAVSVRFDRLQAACAAGLLGAYMVFAHISFGAWQEWWIAAPFIGAALIAAARNPHEDQAGLAAPR
jgi:O-antigen ligase